MFAAGPAIAQNGGGPVEIVIRDRASEQIEALRPEMTRRAAALGLPVTRSASRAAATQFQYPLQPWTPAAGFASEAISNHVDRNPAAGLKDFNCGTRTYEGHKGVDIYLTPYSWDVMDRRELRVVAALPGVIVDKQDGHFDRQCSWSGSPPANYVIVRHDNALLGYYWHLKQGSVTAKAIGARVALGESLGFVGSSGFSTGPHLHFEVHDSVGVVDPYAGRCNTAGTKWTHQARPVDTAVVRVAAHSVAPPSPVDNCDDPTPGYASRFLPGAQVFAAGYFRDQTPSTKPLIAIVRPDGGVATSWLAGAPSSGFWSSSYWYTSYVLPNDAPGGEWRVRITFAGRVYEQVFWVGAALPANGPTSISATVASPVRTVTANTAANFVVTLRNKGAPRAMGCRLSLTRPINADVTFRETNASGTPVGPVNFAFPILPNASKGVMLTIKPRTGFTAVRAEFGLLAKCTNSAASPFSRTTTMLTLTSG